MSLFKVGDIVECKFDETVELAKKEFLNNNKTFIVMSLHNEYSTIKVLGLDTNSVYPEYLDVFRFEHRLLKTKIKLGDLV